MEGILDSIRPYYYQLDAALKPLENDLLRLANPDLDPDASITKYWHLTSLADALIAMSVYAVIVFVGIIIRSGQSAPKTVSKGERRPEPFGVVKSFQALYNIIQVALCAYMITKTVLVVREEGYGLICNAFIPERADMAAAVYVFYLSKIFDFFDTLFIVIRGKWAQFSFLHIYHHFSIFFVYWVNIRAGYDGDIYYTVIANSFIHFVMYLYYFLSSIGQRPWWAKQLTSLQMIQFVTMMSQAIYILVRGCPFPKNITIFYLGYILSLFLLFANFFLRRYTSRKPKTE